MCTTVPSSHASGCCRYTGLYGIPYKSTQGSRNRFEREPQAGLIRALFMRLVQKVSSADLEIGLMPNIGWVSMAGRHHGSISGNCQNQSKDSI